MVWGGRREEASQWGIHVYLWWIHYDICQNQYNIVKFKNKRKLKKKKKIKKREKEKRAWFTNRSVLDAGVSQNG